MIQLEAVLAVAVLVAVAAGYLRVRSRLTEKAVVGAGAEPAGGEPYILYFSGEGCTVCRTHQEPALSLLAGVRVRKVDAIAEPELAKRYRVYTLPTTVVIGRDGRALHVNYGYAPGPKLAAQLATR